jgi:hypothetical protein
VVIIAMVVGFRSAIKAGANDNSVP